MANITKFVWIGFGSIATSLMELFNLEQIYYNIPHFIYDPKKPSHPELFENRNVKYTQKAITKENHKRLLKDVDDKTLIIDLSVNVDSIMMLKLAKAKGCYYVNTSIENYEEHTNANAHNNEMTYNDIKDNTLYHRELMAQDLMKGTRKTRFLNCGFNPGCIQAFVKRGLREYSKLKHIPIVNGNYAKFAHDIGLTDCYCVEYDSQKTNLKATKQCFLNTWSSTGFQEEGADNIMLSLNNETIADMTNAGIKMVAPNEGNVKNLRFLSERGMNVKRKCITLDHNGKPFEYEGMLIPHAEIASLSEFLQYKGNAPNIMYIYRPCDVALDSLQFFKKNDYNILPDYYVLEGGDVKPMGFDSIGAYMKFSNGDIMWCGSVVSIEDARKLGFKISNATSIQVSGFLHACIDFIFKHPNFGLNESEDIPHKELFKVCDKYMGNIYCKML